MIFIKNWHLLFTESPIILKCSTLTYLRLSPPPCIHLSSKTSPQISTKWHLRKKFVHCLSKVAQMLSPNIFRDSHTQKNTKQNTLSNVILLSQKYSEVHYMTLAYNCLPELKQLLLSCNPQQSVLSCNGRWCHQHCQREKTLSSSATTSASSICADVALQKCYSYTSTFFI